MCHTHIRAAVSAAVKQRQRFELFYIYGKCKCGPLMASGHFWPYYDIDMIVLKYCHSAAVLSKAHAFLRINSKDTAELHWVV